MMRYQIELPQFIHKDRIDPRVNEAQRNLYCHELTETHVEKIIRYYHKCGRNVDIFAVIDDFRSIQGAWIWHTATDMVESFKCRIWQAGYVT